MKKFLLTSTALLLIAFASHAQKTKSKASVNTKALPTAIAPAVVKSNFNKEFGQNTAHWVKTHRGNYQATFNNKEGNKQIVEYNKSGNWIGTKTFFLSANYPSVVTSAIANDFENWSAVEVYKSELNDVSPFYKVKIKSDKGKLKEVLISEQGSVAE